MTPLEHQAFWTGRLAFIISAALGYLPKDARTAREILHRELREFERSDAVSEYLREQLRETR
jgi:hypothetical protein